jgi:hypothetical protein
MLEMNLAAVYTAAFAAVFAVACLLIFLVHRKKCNQKHEAAEVGMYHAQKTCENRADEIRNELKSEIRQAIESLEAGLRGPELALSQRRITRNNRAEALRLLRSGVAPETAAATLSMPRYDVVLLAKVASALAIE